MYHRRIYNHVFFYTFECICAYVYSCVCQFIIISWKINARIKHSRRISIRIGGDASVVFIDGVGGSNDDDDGGGSGGDYARRWVEAFDGWTHAFEPSRCMHPNATNPISPKTRIPKNTQWIAHIALSIEYLFIYLFIHYILYECMYLPQNPIKFQDKINDVKNN